MSVSRRSLILLLFTWLVAGCGGSGGSSNPLSVSAGADRRVVEQRSIQLDGSATGADISISSVSWQQLSGSPVQIQNPSQLNTLVDLPAVPVGVTEDVVLRLTVQEDQGNSASDDIVLRVDSQDFLVGVQILEDGAQLALFDPQSRTSRAIAPIVSTSDGFITDFKIASDGGAVAYRVFIDDSSPSGPGDRFELFIADVSSETTISISVSSLVATPFPLQGAYEWSFDGSQLLFLSDEMSAGVRQLFVVDADGANQQRVELPRSDQEVFAARWAPNSSLIALRTRDPVNFDERDLLVFDARSADSSMAVTELFTSTSESVSTPLWSPDGSRVAYLVGDSADFTAPRDLFVVDRDGLNRNRLSTLAPVAPFALRSVAWSPGGEFISYEAATSDPQQTGLVISSVDTATSALVSFQDSTDLNVSRIAWSPDGNRLAFATAFGGLGIYDALLGAVVEEVLFPSPEASFSWAPDGTELLYLSPDFRELVVTNGMGQRRVISSAESRFDPVRGSSDVFPFDPPWSPDSSNIVYVIDFLDISIGPEPLLVERDGTERTNLLRDVPAPIILGGTLAFSADSNAIAFATSGPESFENDNWLYLLDRDEFVNVTDVALGGDLLFPAQWWPSRAPQ